MMTNLKFTLAYVASIEAVNIGFMVVPMVPIGSERCGAPMSLLVGAIFVLRDFAQREIGHGVLIAMLIELLVLLACITVCRRCIGCGLLDL